MKPNLNLDWVTPLVRQALLEDVGSGDATTQSVIPGHLQATAYFRAREECIVAGLPIVAVVFSQLATGVVLNNYLEDGTTADAGATLARVTGNAQAILTGERTALNFLQHLCGIASLTHRYVKALGNSRTRLLDTRKTTPGLRHLEKYAVAIGGGTNHRMGLYDQIMIKDNHRHLIGLSGAGGLSPAVEMCRRKHPELEIEVEVDNLEELQQCLTLKVSSILLDNMSTVDLIEAIKIRDRIHAPTLLEASGGITLERLPEIANIGLDFISVGALTHSVKAIDIGLDLSPPSHYPDTP